MTYLLLPSVQSSSSQQFATSTTNIRGNKPVNELQKMWVKAYEEYLAQAKAEGRVGTTWVNGARVHADNVMASLKRLEN
jgi:hypothetical protein